MSNLQPIRRDSAPIAPAAEGSGSDGDAARIAARFEELEKLASAQPGAEGERLRRQLGELRELVTRQERLAGRIEDHVAERTRELASLTNFLQTHSEREKQSLARELHDALGGILTPAKMDLAWLEARLKDKPEYDERMRRLGALIDQGIEIKRRIIEDLRPSLLDHLGLASAVTWYVDEATRAAGMESRMRVSDKLERLPSDLEIALYRLVQESVTNIVKHARATRVELELDRPPEGLRLAVADNGVGIADLEYAKKLSHGLAGMMHRVRSLHGTFDVESAPGGGTRICVFVPLPQR